MSEVSSRYQSKKTYSTIFSLTCYMLGMISVLSLLAWVLLFSWFGIHVVKNKFSMKEIQVIINNQSNFIGYFYPKNTNRLLVKINKIEDMFHIILGRIDGFLIKVHHKFILTNISIIWLLLIEKTTTVIIIRLFTFIMSLPLLVSVIFIGVVDGLGQRDIRKFEGARESAFFFHRIKPMISKIFYLLFLMYLCLPFSFHSLGILMPMIVLLSLTIMLTLKSYKKYL